MIFLCMTSVYDGRIPMFELNLGIVVAAVACSFVFAMMVPKKSSHSEQKEPNDRAPTLLSHSVVSCKRILVLLTVKLVPFIDTKQHDRGDCPRFRFRRQGAHFVAPRHLAQDHYFAKLDDPMRDFSRRAP